MMDSRTNQQKRPASMIFISVVFIVISLFLFFHVIKNITTTPAIFEMIELMRQMEADVPVHLLAMIFIFKNFHVFGSLEMIFSIFIITAAIHFLKLRAWARTALELSAWVLVFTIVVYISLWTLTVFTMLNIVASLIGASDVSVMKLGYILLLGVLFVFLILPIGASIYLLRSERIRDIFGRI
jgi:hypothetical protein